MNLFQKLIESDLKCELCESDLRALYGYGWDNDRLLCSDDDCGGEYVFATTTECDE